MRATEDIRGFQLRDRHEDTVLTQNNASAFQVSGRSCKCPSCNRGLFSKFGQRNGVCCNGNHIVDM